MPKPVPLIGTGFTDEAGAHTFRISAEDSDGNPVAFTGDVSGRFLAPDDAVYDLTGSINADGEAEVTLDADCYAVPGRFILSVYVTDGDTSTVVYCAFGTIYRTTSDNIIITGTPAPTLEQFTSVYNQALAIVSSSVRYDVAQDLQSADKARARSNIGAAAVSVSGTTLTFT
jgi:hypothetical protein